jgi:hypothetical protein
VIDELSQRSPDGTNSALHETLHELLLNGGVDLCRNESLALLLGFAALSTFLVSFLMRTRY